MKLPTTISKKAGFTLAEVLVTVLIMGGIMVSVTQILYTARISRDNIHNIRESQLAGPAIMDMIERDLRGLITYNRTKEHHLRVIDDVDMGVDGDSLDFVTTTDSLIQRYDQGNLLSSTINEVGYRLRPNPEYDNFLEIYRREDFGVDDLPFEGGQFTFLHDRVKGFDIQVYAEDGPDAEPATDGWGMEDEEEIGVPARLEITLVLELQRRIEREALRMAPTYLVEVTYKRVIRLPESLRGGEEELVVPLIPIPASGDSDSPDADEPGGTGNNGGGSGGSGRSRGNSRLGSGSADSGGTTLRNNTSGGGSSSSDGL
jgi:prepilin-type N-terminal cleavage/methylation domain-containing protein